MIRLGPPSGVSSAVARWARASGSAPRRPRTRSPGATRRAQPVVGEPGDHPLQHPARADRQGLAVEAGEVADHRPEAGKRRVARSASRGRGPRVMSATSPRQSPQSHPSATSPLKSTPNAVSASIVPPLRRRERNLAAERYLPSTQPVVVRRLRGGRCRIRSAASRLGEGARQPSARPARSGRRSAAAAEHRDLRERAADEDPAFERLRDQRPCAPRAARSRSSAAAVDLVARARRRRTAAARRSRARPRAAPAAPRAAARAPPRTAPRRAAQSVERGEQRRQPGGERRVLGLAADREHRPGARPPPTVATTCGPAAAPWTR